MMDASFVYLFHKSLDPAGPFYKQQYESVNIFSFNGIIAWKVYPMFLFSVSAMLVGSLYFNKVSFIKVSLVICVLLIGSYALNWGFAKMLFSSINDASIFDHVTIPIGNEDGSIILPERASNIFINTWNYVFPAILFVTSFIRLREKEF